MKEISNKIIKTELVNWKDLKFLQSDNLKDLSKQAEEKLKQSILNNDFCQTFNVWQKGKDIFLLDGHHRVKILKKLEEEGNIIPDKFPANFIDCKNRKEACKLLLIYSSIYAKIEQDGLMEFLELEELTFDDLKFDTELENIDFDVMEKAFNDNNKTEEELDEIPEEKKESVSKLGDLFLIDGRHRVLCGDSTKQEDVERLMDEKKADMVFTDPPYGVNYDGGHFHSGDVNIKRKREKLQGDNNMDIYKDFLPVIYKYIDGPCYMWFADTRGKDVYNAVEDNNFIIHSLIIWHKVNATYAAMGAQYKQRHEPLLYFKPKNSTLKWTGESNENTLWEVKRDGINEFHPTQKPVALAIRAINNHSAVVVLDAFLGSGSTLIACEETGRNCFGIELEPLYIDVILRRYHKLYPDKKIECLNRGFPFNELFS